MKDKNTDIIYIDDIYLMTLKYNVFKDGKLNRIEAIFENNLSLNDPYLIALSLLKLSENSINEIKDKLNRKKILQFFRKTVPYEIILYKLTGGDNIWLDKELNLSWNFEKALKFWKEELDDRINSCYTIYDLIISFNYLKNEIIFRCFNNFIMYLNEENRKME